MRSSDTGAHGLQHVSPRRLGGPEVQYVHAAMSNVDAQVQNLAQMHEQRLTFERKDKFMGGLSKERASCLRISHLGATNILAKSIWCSFSTSCL